MDIRRGRGRVNGAEDDKRRSRLGAAVGWVEGVCKGRFRWGAAVGWVEGVGDGSGGSGAEGVIGVGSRGAEDRGLDGYRVARRGLGGGFLMRLLMLDTLIMTDASIRSTVTSPGCELQFGRVWMHELSMYLLSSTFLDFQKSLAAEKSNSCPGCA